MAAEFYPVIVVGGGASGMAAAITAAGILGPGKVLLLERGARAGRKLLAAGNGRCNLSNRFADVSRYHGADPGFVGPAFQRFPVEENLKFFERLGLLAVEEEEGKLYPMSLQAAAVLDVLRLALEEGGVNLLTGIDVLSVRPGKDGFSLRLQDRRRGAGLPRPEGSHRLRRGGVPRPRRLQRGLRPAG